MAKKINKQLILSQATQIKNEITSAEKSVIVAALNWDYCERTGSRKKEAARGLKQTLKAYRKAIS